MRLYLNFIYRAIVLARQGLWYAALVAVVAGMSTGSVTRDIANGDFGILTVINMFWMSLYVPSIVAFLFTNIGKDE